ncbi:hypothetical protein ACN9MN_18030 [Chryseobacterium sp. S-02]|uniref:hypothetical protein n=1 Tax=Chryseobacterium sp. S-02 TaxID=3404064 RepID=UPI003CF70306
MALPKKTSRIITVNNIEYSWMASGNDDIIHLIVCLNENPGQKLHASFDYVNVIENVVIEVQITPSIVKQVIEYAIDEGWNPYIKGKGFNIGIMNNFINYTT